MSDSSSSLVNILKRLSGVTTAIYKAIEHDDNINISLHFTAENVFRVSGTQNQFIGSRKII